MLPIEKKHLAGLAGHMPEVHYQSLHHFLSDANWDQRAVNIRRVEVLQRSRQTHFLAEGWLIQDDTGMVHHPQAEKERPADGCARQYIGEVGKVEEGIVFVTTHYADRTKHYPLTADLYWPQAALKRIPKEERRDKEQQARRERDKIQIALDHLDRLQEAGLPRAPAKRVIADSWYGSSPRYIHGLEDRGYEYICEVRSNRSVFLKPPGARKAKPGPIAEVLTLAKRSDFRPVLCPRADGTVQKRYWLARDLKFKGLSGGKRHVVIVVDDPARPHADTTRYLLVRVRDLSDEDVVRAYSLRNWVERFYRDGKRYLGLRDVQVHREERMLRHWTLVFAAHTVITYHRLKGSFSAWLPPDEKSPAGAPSPLLSAIWRSSVRCSS